VCSFSDPVTRISYFLYNSSSMSPVTPGSPGLTEPTLTQLSPHLSFSGYNGQPYGLLSPAAQRLYARKRAFVLLLIQRVSSANKASLQSLLENCTRSGESHSEYELGRGGEWRGVGEAGGQKRRWGMDRDIRIFPIHSPHRKLQLLLRTLSKSNSEFLS